jgi:hypothetical protein
MLKALLAGAAVTVAIAASPAFAQSTFKPQSGPAPTSIGPMGQTVQEVVPSEPATPADRAQVRRDWNEMAREWQQRERSGAVPPQGSIGAPSGPAIGPSTYGGFGSDTRIAPSQQQMPMRGSGLQGLPQEPLSPAERAQVRRDWDQMAREWEQRQRSGYAPPTGIGQPPLPIER